VVESYCSLRERASDGGRRALWPWYDVQKVQKQSHILVVKSHDGLRDRAMLGGWNNMWIRDDRKNVLSGCEVPLVLVWRLQMQVKNALAGWRPIMSP